MSPPLTVVYLRVTCVFIVTLCLLGCRGQQSFGSVATMDEFLWAIWGDDSFAQGEELVTVVTARREARREARVAQPCDRLFGNETTTNGLPEGTSQPFCECGGMSFSPPEYTRAEIDHMASMQLQNPAPLLTENPYRSDEPIVVQHGAVCGVLLDPNDSNSYRLQTFDSESDALAADARITHEGSCGACSALGNLAVYAGSDDLTGPARRCAARSFLLSEEESIDCIEEIGFDEACAQMWYYNALNTRRACIGECAFAYNATYHNEDGSLNACIQCDEDESGPVFAAYAGRTRRNSGLPSSLARPCSQVAQVVHNYD